jgi:beta-phosphoglucomutase
MMSFKGAIFDVDGVIVDTAPLHHQSWKIVLKRDYGMKFTFADFKNKIDGMPRAKGVKALLPEATDEEVEYVCDEKQKYFEILLEKKGVKVFKSAVQLIRDLKKRGIKLAMASSSRNARPILEREGIFQYFDMDAEGAMAKRGKPYPDIFLQAAKKLGLKPSECVVFEDAQIGLDAAIAGKIKCIGIAREHKLKKADMMVKDIRYVTYEKINSLFQ